ncbi:hypothetical protein JAAARDRAFT_198784 [Jaapia argillacea MUCL 33604]|uniref:Uncharacterized protein n=1 Tax=Jaapia argillacea MUCL 33604 TaxID=933084 RepID=A0A067PAX1_9AGAM|nr:hypothetical protein JAAARDRAFT_198784 [Jaapia argillacea MUCL 33604]
MSSNYSDNGCNGESPLVSSLPSLLSVTTSLPTYGSSCKEDNDVFDSIYYNPPEEVKREPLSPRIPTPFPPRIPTPITTSPSTPLTEPPTPNNLWLGAKFRASYNPLPSVPTPARSPIHVPTPPPRPWTPPTVVPAYVEPEVGPAFTWPPPPLTKYITRGPNMTLANTYTKHLTFLDQQETQARQGVQAALELWMSWARQREQHLNTSARRDWPQIALVYRRAPPPPNQDLYIPQTVDFNGPLPTNNAKPKVDKVAKLAEFPGPSWDEWNKFTGSQQLAFQEKYWA